MPSNYFNMSRPGITNQKPGYTQVGWIAPMAWFATIFEPVKDGGADNVTIASAHTFNAGKGFIACYALPGSVQASSEATGDMGALNQNWKPMLFIPGDHPELQAEIEALLNDDVILIVNDSDEVNGNALQFGSAFMPAHITKSNFSTGSTKPDGKKGYDVELSTPQRYIYGTDVLHAYPSTDGPTFLIVSDTGDPLLVDPNNYLLTT